MSYECISHTSDLNRKKDIEKKIGPRHIQNGALIRIINNFMLYGILNCITGGCKPKPSQPVMFFSFKQRNSSLFMSLRLHQPVK